MTQSTALETRPLPGALSSGWIIANLFFRVTLGRRRLLWLSAVLLLPVLVALYFLVSPGGSGALFFEEITVTVFLQFLSIVLPLYLGVSAVRDEIEDKTIVFLLCRPLFRAGILGGKIASVALVVSAALVVDLALVYLLVVGSDGLSLLALRFPRLLLTMGVLSLAAFAYTALFALLGVLLRKPMILSLLVGLGWETVVGNIPGAFPRLTLMYYLKSLLGLSPRPSGLMALLIPSIPPAESSVALLTVLLVTLALYGLTLFIGGRKEIRT